MKPTITWILIADGGSAKVFEHLGPGKGLQAIADLQFDQAHLKAGDIMSDRPGRSFASVGHGRSAMEPSTDPVSMRERRFVELVASVLEQRHEAGEFQRLIVAAAPTALGDLRPALTPKLRNAIIAELPKDLTNIPTVKLEDYFSELLPV